MLKSLLKMPEQPHSLLHLLSKRIPNWNRIPAERKQNCLIGAFISRKRQQCQQLRTTNSQEEGEKTRSMMFVILRASSGDVLCQGSKHCCQEGNFQCAWDEVGAVPLRACRERWRQTQCSEYGLIMTGLAKERAPYQDHKGVFLLLHLLQAPLPMPLSQFRNRKS